jgi:hypothetical protein
MLVLLRNEQAILVKLNFSGERPSSNRKRLNIYRKREGEKLLYFNLMSFEDCHNPWMLQIETAMRVPGLPVFIQVAVAW